MDVPTAPEATPVHAKKDTRLTFCLGKGVFTQ